jgi:hypothetical protein
MLSKSLSRTGSHFGGICSSALSDQMDPSGRSDIAPLQYVEQILIAEPLSISAGFALGRVNGGAPPIDLAPGSP